MHTIIINISVVRVMIISFSFHSFCYKMLKLLGLLNFANGGVRNEVLCAFVALLKTVLGGELLDFCQIVFLFDCKTELEIRDFLQFFSFGDEYFLLETEKLFFNIDIRTLSSF